jgi:AcrR family transcriptional regulator
VPPKSILPKASRTYRSELRQRQAEATRGRIVTAAAELFATNGYARTTVAKIAAAAGVSAETVQGQGPKAALLIAAIEQAAFGVIGEENILNLDIGRALLAADSREHAMNLVVAMVADMQERTARLALALIGGAGADPELDRYWTAMTAGIKLQNRRVLEAFRDRGWIRDDVPFDEVVQTSVILSSVETYLRITHYDGWSPDAYRRWYRRMLAEAVFAR